MVATAIAAAAAAVAEAAAGKHAVLHTLASSERLCAAWVTPERCLGTPFALEVVETAPADHRARRYGFCDWRGWYIIGTF